MHRNEITREALGSAFRYLRTSAGLTQRQVCDRATQFEDYGKLGESQVSDFERGRIQPSLSSLLNLLAACSADGETVDFAALQWAILTSTSQGVAESKHPREVISDSGSSDASVRPTSRRP